MLAARLQEADGDPGENGRKKAREAQTLRRTKLGTQRARRQ